jgi:hypothetical protein
LDIYRKTKAAVDDFLCRTETALINNGNLGDFYRYVNNKIVNKSGVALKGDSGDFITEDCAKAEKLNAFFNSVFTFDNHVPPADESPSCNRNDDYRNNDVIDDNDFSVDAIPRVILKLKPKFRSGFDGFNAFFLNMLLMKLRFHCRCCLLSLSAVVRFQVSGGRQLSLRCLRKVAAVTQIITDLFL